MVTRRVTQEDIDPMRQRLNMNMSMRLKNRAMAGVVLASVVTLVVAISGSLLVTQPGVAQAATSRVTGTAERASIAASVQTIHPSATPSSSAARLQAAGTRDTPFHSRLSAASYASVKAHAKDNAPTSDTTTSDNGHNTLSSFAGIQSSAAVCPPVGCNPPDMGLAASPKWVFQGVNTAFAVFDTHGNMQPGYPKFIGDFFGVPNPGACAGNLPFVSDPRAFYDPNDRRFVAAALEVEGAFGVNDCPFKTTYWIGVSQTSDPRGAWNVYAFDMSLGTTNAADFTMIGFDAHAIYFSANMFNQEGTAYSYAEIFGASKARMEAGLPVTAHGFFNLTVSGPGGSLQVDTVQPALTEDPGRGPGGEFFVDTFNGPIDPVSGHTCTSAADACRGLAVWSITNSTSNTPLLSFAYVGNTKSYTFPPPADQTTCTECIDSSDLRISATPVEKNGYLYAAWETGVNNGTQVVPGIIWSQLRVDFVDHGSLSATQVRGNYYNFGGDDAVIYPALMPDANGNLFMVFDHTSSTVNPEVRLTLRQGGNFSAPGLLIKAGEAPYRPTLCGTSALPVCRWGDYSATSYDGFTTNTVYFAGQYSNASGFSRNWGTWIGRVHAS